MVMRTGPRDETARPTVIADGVNAMRSTMQNQPLTVERLFCRAERLFGDKQIYSVSEGEPSVTTYAAWARRTRRLASALTGLGLDRGARVATFASNTARHLEASFAVPLAGYVFHPLNVRLPEDQLRFIVNDAADELIIVERSLLDRLVRQLGDFGTVRHLVIVDDVPGAVPLESLPAGIDVSDYEQLLADAAEMDLLGVDETSAASVCYTSGTTGNPKGVVYSHRSLWLHAMSLQQVDVAGISENDTVLPLVPFFHANAWDLGFGAAGAGANLVMCGSDLSGATVARLIEEHRVTFATAVPAVWSRVLPELVDRDASSVRMLCSGGSAVPARLSDLCRELTGAPIMQVWGMTETSAFAAMARTRPHIDAGDAESIANVTSSQGVPVAGVEVRIVAEGTTYELPWDGVATGELQCRGPWVTARYHGEEHPGESTTPDGWLRTGDAASIDPDGYIRLRDRLKDLIKSGGEWIPSAEVERALQTHPAVDAAAVIGVSSLRWDERPIAIVTFSKDSQAAPDELLEWLRPRLAKLWLPDEIHVLDELPATSVGKVDKKALRRTFAQQVRP